MQRSPCRDVLFRDRPTVEPKYTPALSARPDNKIVIRGDDLGGVHQARRNIGDVALESHQGAGSGQGRLIEDLVSFVGGDEARALRTSLAGDDGPGPVGLRPWRGMSFWSMCAS